MVFEGFSAEDFDVFQLVESAEDFDVFQLVGLDQRMDGIIGKVRPKLDVLGKHFAPTLSASLGEEMFHHVAKHARRTVNPPNDTWVAFSNSKRGYKMLPHFQIGLFESHLFIWFAIIYECPVKARFGEMLLQNKQLLHEIPDHFVWSGDHMKPEAVSQEQVDHEVLLERLQNVKKAELLCGIHIDRHDPILANGEKLLTRIESTFQTLLPLYRLATQGE